MRFEGQNVIVTGATGGIGSAIVDGFLAEGATVVGLGRRPEALAALEQRDEPRLHAAAIDLCDPAAIAATAEAWIERLGRIHVLVNCAGVFFEAGVLDISQADWDETLATNLTAPFVLSQVTARHMVEHGGGAIVNISSTDAVIAESPWAGYNASKAGLEQLTRSMAFELAHRGVRVNAVAPGSTMTPMMTYTLEQSVWEHYLRQMPMRRFATPQEQAHAVLFLASAEASYISGVTLPVDGAEFRGFWARPDLEPPIPPLPEGA